VNGIPFLLEFADNWPFFIKNNLLTDKLIELADSNIIVDQTKALKILSNKHICLPQTMYDYQVAFLKLQDKTIVKDTLKDFLFISSYIGQT
jgi:hypothetical protein